MKHVNTISKISAQNTPAKAQDSDGIFDGVLDLIKGLLPSK
jgi:hypothetical protein